MRAAADVLAANRQGQPGLWRHGISGDKPIVLVRIGDGREVAAGPPAAAAHAYWRLKGLEVDLVMLNEQPTGYFEELQQQAAGPGPRQRRRDLIDKPGGVFVRKAAQMSRRRPELLLAAARVVLAGDRGSLAAQLDRIERPCRLPAPRPPRTEPGPTPCGDEAGSCGRRRRRRSTEGANLLFANGHGGFTPDGREYVIVRVARPALPPAPWINVVANPSFGFLVSERGGGYTWAGNSQANRLTPWSNDPVSDPPGEVVYLRDEETGEVWTPTPLPLRVGAGRCRPPRPGLHVFEQHGHGLEHELLLFVPPDDPVKLICLKVRNTGDSRAACRRRSTPNGCWARCATRRRCTS